MTTIKLPCGHLMMRATALVGGRERTFVCEDCDTIWQFSKGRWKTVSQHGAPVDPIDPKDAIRERERTQDERLHSQMVEGLLRLKRIADS